MRNDKGATPERITPNSKIAKYLGNPTYLLQKYIDDKLSRLESYKQRPNVSQTSVDILQKDIDKLEYILSAMKDLEPAETLYHVGRIIRRNILLNTDITVIIIPNKPDIPPYPYASAIMEDLTPCNIPDAHALLEMHRDGIASVEVDDFRDVPEQERINNVLSLYANRGALYTERV